MTDRMKGEEETVSSESVHNSVTSWRVLTEYINAVEQSEDADAFVTWMRQRDVNQLGEAVACAQLVGDLLEELTRALIGILEEKGRVVKEIVITDLQPPKMDN